MMRLVGFAAAIVQIAGFVALMLGLAFWSGRSWEFVNPHMALGLTVVTGLLVLAALALVRRVRLGLAAGALVWGVLTLALGITQTSLLTGDFHWIVQTVHLLLGLGAIAIAAVLARAMRQHYRPVRQRAAGTE